MPKNEELNRQFVLNLQQLVREKNCAIIDPLIPELTIDAFEGLIEVTAKVRGAFIKQYFELAEKTKNDLPKAEELQKLRGMREIYEEMAAAHLALETAIEMGYLTVKQE